jgi:hypothetical protein
MEQPTMSNELTTITDDGFAQAAAEADRRVIEGEILKFVDGVWTVSKQPVPAGTQFIPVRLQMAWVKWRGQKPVDYVWPQINGYLPARETLGDDDEDDWPAGLNGNPEDPWRNTRFIYMVNTRTAETVTFTNHTVGIRRCYEALGKAVTNMRAAHPSALPIVELASMPMKIQSGNKLRRTWKLLAGSRQDTSTSRPNKYRPPSPAAIRWTTKFRFEQGQRGPWSTR